MRAISPAPTSAGPVPPGLLPAARIVTERELFVKLRDRTFLVSTVVTLLLVAVAFGLPAFLQAGEGEYRVAVSGAAAAEVAGSLAEREEDTGLTVESVPAADVRAAEALVRAGEVDVALVEVGTGSPAADVALVADTEVPPDLATAVDDVVRDRGVAAALAGFGADDAAVSAALAPVTVERRVLDPAGSASTEALLLEFAFAAVFFFTALTFGLTIAQSVTEEKQQRVVELLVAAVPVRALLIGKIVGNLVLALGQVVLLIAVGLLAASVAGQGELVPLLAGSAGWFVVFFVFGFAMLACLWAAAGALASRYEDLAATTLPIQMLVVLPFIVALSVRDGVARDVLSYVPLTSPIVMPQRLVAGDAQWWEAAVALVLIAGTALVIVLAAERLYRGSLLDTRGRVSLGRAWAGAEG
ncbi:MAG: ABC transporter permease [Kineosporiaceae bacterium]